MSLRQEFVALAMQEGIPVQELCQRYTITPKTAYKWLQRARQGEPDWAADHSRRPHTSPGRTAPEVEAAVVASRLAHATWGGRKLHHLLRQQGVEQVPAPSTITDILRRHDLLDAERSRDQRPPQRFEHPEPNDLWQLDFMGHLALAQGRVHPMTLIDDHSRFALGVFACAHQQGALVQELLISVFRRFGLPMALLTDNGPPWGPSGRGGLTGLEAWLIRQGIRVCHGRPYHPQTQGKIERLHRTLAADVTRTRRFADLATAQDAFDHWRGVYNHERPHEALAYQVPAARYRPSPFPFAETLPPIEYALDDAVRTVRSQGAISFQNRSYFISRGLIGLPVAVRPTTIDGVFAVFFCHQQVAILDLTDRSKV